VSFKQYVRSEIAAGLDETYRFESWASGAPGDAYHAIHCAIIEAYETCVPTLRRVLAGGGKRILESGCGTGRWMAYFEQLGHQAYGVDDSAAPLQIAKRRRPQLRLVRGDAVDGPWRAQSFDVVFSAYVAEHFEDGPEPLFREIHRLLKPNGVLVVVVPYDSIFRRLITHRVLELFYLLARLRGQPLAFTEFRYSRADMDGFLQRSGFHIEHVEPDDFRLPWGKGLSLDLGPLVRPRGAEPGSWHLNWFGRVLARTLNSISPWLSCAGILYVARKVDDRP
jgi:SAM-dependent methyltransferase